MLANIAGPDIWIVVVVVLVLFGGSQLPKIARNLGMAGKEFRKAHEEALRDDPPAPTAAVIPPPPMVTPPMVTPPMVTPPPAASVAASDDRVTLSKAELDALLDEREARAKRQAAS